MGKEETGLWLLQDLRKCLQRELQSHNPHQDLVDSGWRPRVWEGSIAFQGIPGYLCNLDADGCGGHCAV